MVETIVQYLGMLMVGIILVCIVWSFGNYVMGSIDRPEKQNKKLMDNMNKLEKR